MVSSGVVTRASLSPATGSRLAPMSLVTDGQITERYRPECSTGNGPTGHPDDLSGVAGRMADSGT
ncbi:hypothetical protein GCM10023107_68080 [Actinoplanes octamycinicus]|nr:hypothetical protein Aoc01nite_25000 [Actinoplanes octamycinicus]